MYFSIAQQPKSSCKMDDRVVISIDSISYLGGKLPVIELTVSFRNNSNDKIILYHIDRIITPKYLSPSDVEFREGKGTYLTYVVRNLCDTAKYDRNISAFNTVFSEQLIEVLDKQDSNPLLDSINHTILYLSPESCTTIKLYPNYLNQNLCGKKHFLRLLYKFESNIILDTFTNFKEKGKMKSGINHNIITKEVNCIFSNEVLIDLTNYLEE